MYGKDRNGVGRPILTDSNGVLLSAAGKYVDAALSGRLFFSANATRTTTSTTLNTTFVGLGLCNPTGSGKLIVVHEFSYAFVAASAAGLILSLAVTTDSGFAQDTNTPILCARHGYATPVGITDASATIIAPVIVKPITQKADAATTTFVEVPHVVDLGGSIVLPAGRSIVTDTTTAVGATTAIFSFMWEEIDA